MNPYQDLDQHHGRPAVGSGWQRVPFGVLTVLFLWVGGDRGWAGLFIDVGHVFLQPGTASQAVEFTLENRGTEPVEVAGLSWNVQVADSGPPERGGLGTLTGPGIDFLDLLTDTLFAGNNLGAVDAGSALQFANWTTVTETDAVVVAPGQTVLLGTAYFDAADFVDKDEWQLFFGLTINGPTVLFDRWGTPLPLTIIDGRLTVVPEPEWAAGCVGLTLILYGGSRRWRPFSRPTLNILP